MVRPALKSPSRGAALLLAMLIAALAAVVAVAVAAEQQRWFADVANRRDQVQAQALALAGVQWARQIMQDDARAGTLDHLGEPWAFPLPRTPLENGSIEGGIEDAQARLNINNLAKDDALGKEERARFSRLFALRGIAPGAMAAISGSMMPISAGETGDKAGNAPRAKPLPANLWPVRAAEVAAIARRRSARHHANAAFRRGAADGHRAQRQHRVSRNPGGGLSRHFDRCTGGARGRTRTQAFRHAVRSAIADALRREHSR